MTQRESEKRERNVEGSTSGEDSTKRRAWFQPGQLSGFVRRMSRVMDFWTLSEERESADRLAQIRAWCHEAYQKRGKIAGMAAIARVADAYELLDEPGRDTFFAILQDDFSVDESALDSAILAYQTAEGGPQRQKALVNLTRTLESPRHALFKQFNTIPAGIKFLLDLRADLSGRLRAHAELAPVEYELRRLLVAFFNPGFLHLERLGWESPAALLEKLVEYEAVHRIENWQDLKHRLISDRACYAFIHPAMPHEPVIFIEVALVRGVADSIQTLLKPQAPNLRPDQADTAIFYGISNAQIGLRGIPLGNLLIKQVAAKLRGEVPNLTTFCTLSPLPRFRRDFLDQAIEDGSIAQFFITAETDYLQRTAGVNDPAEAVARLLREPAWHTSIEAAKALEPGILRAALHYLTEVRRDNHAACPVAHFHGSNGALLSRVNWLGDTSPNGISQSAGVMVNYLYDMENFENHQFEYFQTGRIHTLKQIFEV